jgi:aspartyl-tRNA(Asn)/glutamyl-tRNA(Gln) amidotransferase subunit A
VSKRLSPVELAKDHLKQIQTLNPVLNAFILVSEERALADARASEARQMADELLGPLDGIPIAHKDIFNTAGIATTGHSKVLRDNVPSADAFTVRRLADAGTVMMGKLATHEFAYGGPDFDLPWPPARNPWDVERFTGGSSSGTGAAVAAGMVLGGTGSDTGGSIRSPAALCGIAGIKPTYGLCSRSGIMPLAYTMDHAGVMAWTAEDCALLLQGMAGYDQYDPATIDRPIADFSADLQKGVKGLRIGVVRHYFEEDARVSDATLASIESALEIFRAGGAQLREVTLPPLADFHAVGYVIMLTEALSVHAPRFQSRFNEYCKMFRDRVAVAALVNGTDLMQAQRLRRVLCQQLAKSMSDVDIVVSATAASEAPRLADVPKWTSIEVPSLVMPFSLSGVPAVSVCTGFGPSGLPLAMQLVGKPFDEPTLFRVAHAYERATEWRGRRPPELH